MPRRTGLCLFGGSFDPPHHTHRRLAATACELPGVARLVVLPCGDHPHKGHARMQPAQHRVAMCQLAFAGLDGVEVDDRETRRAGKSYTVDTLRQFRQELGDDTDLFWLIGSDNLPQLPTWHEHHELLALATLVTYPRAGFPIDPAQLAAIDLTRDERDSILANQLAVAPDGVNATQIRHQLARGERPADVDDDVLDYIDSNALYR